MSYDPLVIMGIAISIGIGHYSIFYLYMEKSFVKRYKDFKDTFDNWMKNEVDKFYDNLSSMVKEKADPERLLEFINKWATRTADLSSIFEAYKGVSGSVKWIFLLLVGSIITSGLSMSNPNALNPDVQRPLFWADIAVAFLFFAILLIFWYIYSFHKISSKVTQFELGEPIERIL
jgi:hypothetical protein